MLKIEICNLAIARIGSTAFIDSIDDQMQEAVVCKKFFDMVANKEMRAAFYPSQCITQSLTLLQEEPNDKWLYAYAYPANCARFRVVELLPGLERRDDFWRSPVAINHFVPYERGKLNGDDAVFTNMEEAIGYYQLYLDTNTDIADDVASLIAWGLAAEIATPLGGATGARNDALNMQRMERSSVTARELNERNKEELQAETVTIRGPY